MNVYLKFVKNAFGAIISSHSDNYPTPINLSYFWGIGSLAGIALIIQLVSGILLAMHYTPEVNLAFISVEHIMRDVVGGSGLRYIHANGASMFFIVVYAHMFRGLYYGSYYQPRSLLWYTGVIIFLLMMATAFMGYVLPWGQMSFWGATVITNLFSAIPYIGNYIVQLLWGGFSVDNPTLNRFFSLHYLMPFIIAALAGLHLALLHKDGSNNPLGVESTNDKISFLPYFYVKDFFGVCLFALFFSFFVIYAPNYLGHPDNYIEANPMVTPAHIVPEWYFLPFYAILRTIPDKLGGVALMVFAIVVLLFLPNLDNSYIRSTFFKPFHLIMFWGFLSICLILGWIGQEVVETPFIELSLFVTPGYFAYFLILVPFFSNMERYILEQNFIKKNKGSLLSERRAVLGLSLMTPFSEEFINTFNFFGFYYNIINICLIIFFIIILSLILPTKAKSVKIINLLSSFYLLVLFFFNYFNFISSSIYLSNGNVFNLNWFFILFFFLITFLVGIFFLSISNVFYLEENYKVEYNFLIFFLYLNAVLLLFVTDFISVIIILECIAFSSYILVGFETKNKFSVSSGIKYLIWGSMPAGFFILGLSFLYFSFGTFNQNFLEILLNSYGFTIPEFSSFDVNPQNLHFKIDNGYSHISVGHAKEIILYIMREYNCMINDFCWTFNPSKLSFLLKRMDELDDINLQFLMIKLIYVIESLRIIQHVFDKDSFVFLILFFSRFFPTIEELLNINLEALLYEDLYHNFKIKIFKQVVDIIINFLNLEHYVQYNENRFFEDDEKAIKEILYYVINNNLYFQNKRDVIQCIQHNDLYTESPNERVLHGVTKKIFTDFCLENWALESYNAEFYSFYLPALKNDLVAMRISQDADYIENTKCDYISFFVFNNENGVNISFTKNSKSSKDVDFNDLDNAFFTIRGFIYGLYNMSLISDIELQALIKYYSVLHQIDIPFSFWGISDISNFIDIILCKNTRIGESLVDEVILDLDNILNNFTFREPIWGSYLYAFIYTLYGDFVANIIAVSDYALIEDLLYFLNIIVDSNSKSLTFLKKDVSVFLDPFNIPLNNLIWDENTLFVHKFTKFSVDWLFAILEIDCHLNNVSAEYSICNKYINLFWDVITTYKNIFEYVYQLVGLPPLEQKNFNLHIITDFMEESFQRNKNSFLYIPEDVRDISPFTTIIGHCAIKEIPKIIDIALKEFNLDFDTITGWFNMNFYDRLKKYYWIYEIKLSRYAQPLIQAVRINGFIEDYLLNDFNNKISDFKQYCKLINLNNHYNDVNIIVSDLKNNTQSYNNYNSINATEPVYIIFIAIICILTNILFKLTAAPFHLWAPSIYGNSPLPTITILSIFSKVTIIFLFINLIVLIFENYKFIWQPLMFFIGIFSVIISILGALTEKYIKRFFVYSSISHIGFILLGITTLNVAGIQASIDYLILYIISSLIIWFILMFLTNKVTHLTNLKGLSTNHSVLSFVFALTLFSMAGLPPLGGFFVKYEIFYGILSSNWYFIGYFLFILTLFNFFYYLRIIKIIYFEDNKIIYKHKHFNDLKLRLISILIFVLPLYFILFGESWNFILQQIIIYSLK